MKRIQDEWRYFDETLNMPYPWYTKQCLEWLMTINMKAKVIYEYGAGDSTKWYRAKGAHVNGVDSSDEWAKKSGPECSFKTAKNEHAYTTSIQFQSMYDIVVIDGDYRDACTQHALKALKRGGYLIIDNYKQPSVQADWPLTEKLIEGMDVKYFKEPGHDDWQTIVVTK
jgi:hypothetical protein